MIEVILAVESSTWSPVQIERALGRQPDRKRTVGIPHPPFKRPSTFNGWYLDVPLDVDFPGDGESGISASIVALGDELAERLSRLPSSECTVTLSIVQKVYGEEDTLSLGIHLRADAMQWLVRAQSDIDLDQYFYETSSQEVDR